MTLNSTIIYLDQLAVMFDVSRRQAPDFVEGDTRRDQPSKVYKPYLPRHLATLRERLVSFLLLEVDAQKFHREHSYTYLMKLAHRVDEELSMSFPGGLQLYHDSDGSERETASGTWLSEFLERESLKLSDALYSVAPDGGHIPVLFRNSTIMENLETDGLEVVEDAAPLCATEAENANGSGRSSDDDDEDDYDSEEERFFATRKKKFPLN